MYLSLIERNPNNLGSESSRGVKDAAGSSQVDSGCVEVGAGLEESSRIQTLMDMSWSFRACAGTRDKAWTSLQRGLRTETLHKDRTFRGVPRPLMKQPKMTSLSNPGRKQEILSLSCRKKESVRHLNPVPCGGAE